MLVLDKVKKQVVHVFVDISVPADKGVKGKKNDKISKFNNLRVEVGHLWNIKSSVIPIVVEALGTVSPRFKTFVQSLDLSELNSYLLQKSALLETISILRQVLQLSGAGRTQADWLTL